MVYPIEATPKKLSWVRPIVSTYIYRELGSPYKAGCYQIQGSSCNSPERLYNRFIVSKKTITVTQVKKEMNIVSKYINKLTRGAWFKENARSKTVNVQMVRNADGSYHISGAKAQYPVNGSTTETVTLDARSLAKELRSSKITVS